MGDPMKEGNMDLKPTTYGGDETRLWCFSRENWRKDELWKPEIIPATWIWEK